MMSSLFWIEKLMKLVSISTWYGGPSDMLCEKKRDAGVCATLRTSASFRCRSSFGNWFGFGAGFLMRASFGEIIRLTAAKAFVLPFFCLPIAAREAGGLCRRRERGRAQLCATCYRSRRIPTRIYTGREACAE